ncbi:class I SAM-dependent methyltransferase [Loktanella sp. TSTF-M6]|uniref:Class I SAM-dependent methyltransferase n=1 Tax=Loktanella gaetbuli TaxID=2881335 RepID=A0ABS8BY52_9RHOB|nr:class I SAM-dependent methyltransferase [Loktanella gaetbuli]MCB5200655.1 class I SAM-dependent methyltransferase [Loktanella gaetbuli]
MTPTPDSPQTAYYDRTAAHYDAMQIIEGDEHTIALRYLDGILHNTPVTSLLDVGCGTGRALVHLRDRHPDMTLRGIEPVAAMIAVCRDKGLGDDQVQQGDACALPFADDSFDYVCAFGVLHHIATPDIALREICRVARKGVFVSDHNAYGWGGTRSRRIKNALRRLRLWPLFCRLHTRGKGYYDTDYDGIFYPFSLLDHVALVQDSFPRANFLTTKAYGPDLYRDTSHLALHATTDRVDFLD